ncbi:MAG: glycosyltransferase family A protein [Vicinamibacterales bacterium]
MSQPAIATVVVCTRNPGHRIRQTVASILASTEARFTLLVVDQSDDDQVGRELSALTSDPRVVRVPCESRGLSSAATQGSRPARPTLSRSPTTIARSRRRGWRRSSRPSNWTRASRWSSGR